MRDPSVNNMHLLHARFEGFQGGFHFRNHSRIDNPLLNQFATTATPTLAELANLISNPSGQDLTGLMQEAPALARAASTGFPAIIASLQAQLSSGQIQALREYTPDIVTALANTGQLNGYYDANGHYGRSEPFYGAYGISGGTLTDQSPANRYNGLTVVKTGRCPCLSPEPLLEDLVASEIRRQHSNPWWFWDRIFRIGGSDFSERPRQSSARC